MYMLLHTSPSFEEILGRSRPGSRSLQKQLALGNKEAQMIQMAQKWTAIAHIHLCLYPVKMRRPNYCREHCQHVCSKSEFPPSIALNKYIYLHIMRLRTTTLIRWFGCGGYLSAVRFGHAKCQDTNRRIAQFPSFAFGTGSTSLCLSLYLSLSLSLSQATRAWIWTEIRARMRE